MRHCILTCKNHPDLRWSCKEIAFTEGYGYNGSRNITFDGCLPVKTVYSDKSGVSFTVPANECNCAPTELVRAPEDSLVHP
jgi:hypothetical protein